MILLQVVLLVLAVAYVAVAYLARAQRQPTGHKAQPWHHAAWRRDMTAHEVKLYREMQAHWRREARRTYRKINYSKNNTHGTKK